MYLKLWIKGVKMVKDPICGMDVREDQALKLTTGGKTYYFCSQRCLDKFARENKISAEDLSCCAAPPGTKWYKDKTVIVAAVLVFLSVLSYIVPALLPFKESLVMYLGRVWWAILLGLLLGGVIEHFVPREYIAHFLAKPKKRTILYAVTLGFFMSACSHGILALSIELHKKGAANPAVVAFLLASPWANFPLTIMLIGFFGLIKALYIIFAAILIAITTGFIYQFLESREMIERNKNIRHTEEDYSALNDFKARAKAYRFTRQRIFQDLKGIFSGSISLADMVLWWILAGMGLAALAAAYIPQDVFQRFMGPTTLGLLVTLAVATIMEVCSEGTAPLAFEIYRQTKSIGNPFVFLMAGVVTDYTEIGLLWHNVGHRAAIWLPIIAVPQVVALGILANKIF